MSFSSDVKAELCRSPVTRACCAVAEAYGVLLYANTFTQREIRIITGSADFARRVPRLMRRAFGLDFDSQLSKAGRHTVLTYTDEAGIAQIFRAFGFDPGETVAHHVNLGVLEEDCCRTAFLRGAFLAGGSINTPEKRCHLELVTDHFSVARESFVLFRELGFDPRETVRRGHCVIYFKRTELIEDMLTAMGAPLSAMELMSAKIAKDMRNKINRNVNCDTANADKVVAAAAEQLAAIRRIDAQYGLDKLPQPLHDTALLRIANPEVSLSDLALLADPPVSKSCISHRMKRLMTYTPAGE